MGCGHDPFIAQKVKFRVLFSQKIVQVKFDLSPEYRLKETRNINFDKLAKVFLNTTTAGEMGTTLSANLESLHHEWPTNVWTQLPNGQDLPPSIPSKTVNAWIQPEEDSRTILFFQSEPQLIAGGSFSSHEFDALPKRFFATQKFYSTNHDVEATISVLGPEENRLGGVYFFGNFGINPFASESLALTSKTSELSKDLSWELQAREPAEVINWGRR